MLPAPASLRREALAMVLREVPAVRREAHIAGLLAAERAGRADLGGLFVARRAGELIGAVWAQVLPGRVASVWPAVVQEGVPDAISDGLLAALVQWLGGQEVRVAQTLLAVDASQQRAQLAARGFLHLADLLYMVSLAADFPAREPETRLQFDAAMPAETARLAGILERTYEQTLDCPQLNDVRDVNDVLAGYRTCGTFDPQRWLIARTGASDVGCLLLTDHAALDQWEIVYAGLVPEARGQGYGLMMARHAQRLSRVAGRARLVLAVDAANAPAVKMYERAGFVVWDRRRALVRIFPDGGS
ncbi:MAG TPA: GNAT family N-acetyltransferase [Pirellulales bacterium]|nr:GNAT family N-acetyltransferase [Pirellulales bacterium]